MTTLALVIPSSARAAGAPMTNAATIRVATNDLHLILVSFGLIRSAGPLVQT
jgi:hypothetical protein